MVSPLGLSRMGIKKAEILGPSATKQDQDKAQNSNKQYYMAESARGKDEAHSAFWLATRAGKMSPTCLFGISRVRPARTILLLTKLVRSRWLGIGLVHFCVVIDLEFVLVHKNAKKKLVNNAYILTIPAWQIVVRKIYMANVYCDYRFLINKFIILFRMLQLYISDRCWQETIISEGWTR